MLGLHHLRSRARVSGGLEPFPAESAPKRFLDYIMYGVGVAAPLALLPQSIQIYTTKSAAGLSLVTWILLVFFNILWTLYGIVHNDKPIIITNILFSILHISIIIGVLLY